MSEPLLASLGHEPAPPEVARDLHRALGWPPEAIADLWSVLGPSLRSRLDQRVEATLDAYATRWQVPGPELALALKAMRFLLLEAAGRGLAWDAFEADLDALVGERGRPLARVLAPRYSDAVEIARFETVRGALLDHGCMYVGSEWRLDSVLASTRARSLGAHVAMLTLKVRKATGPEQLTMQILPGDLLQLRGVIDEMIAAAADHRPKS